LAIALSKHFNIRLIYCFEKKGVLENIDNEGSIIHLLNTSRYQELLNQNALKDGILPKLENAFRTIQHGVNEVLIGDATDLLKNMGEETEGTLIRQ
jgi:acetylglutamate kinase